MSQTFGLYFIVQLPSGYKPRSTPKFSCDKRVKWRITSISETSGKDGGAERLNLFGMKSNVAGWPEVRLW
jgi:hypothetical protein